MEIWDKAQVIHNEFSEKYKSGVENEVLLSDLTALEEKARSKDEAALLAVVRICLDRSLGKIYDPDKGLIYVRSLIELDDPDILYILGDHFLLSGEQDEIKANGEAMLRKSANAGNIDAQICLAMHLLDTESFVRHNVDEGLMWLTKAAMADNSEAQYLLACQYNHGDDTPRDKEKAKYWAKKAEQNGDPDAILLVAFLEDS